MSGHTESDFETAIEEGLTRAGRYTKRTPADYDELLALFPDDVRWSRHPASFLAIVRLPRPPPRPRTYKRDFRVKVIAGFNLSGGEGLRGSSST
jgi:hypothetical protein